MNNKKQIDNRINLNNEIIRKLKDTIREQKAEIEQKDAAVSRLNVALEKEKQNLINESKRIEDKRQKDEVYFQEQVEKLKNQNKKAEEEYLKGKNELEEQCNSLRSDIERLAQAVSAAEKQKKSYKYALKDTKDRAEKKVKELESLIEKEVREKEIAKASGKALSLEAEANYSIKLDTERNNWEKEKRSIYSFVAEEFREYYDPGMSIDKESFRLLVEKVKAEMKRMVLMERKIRSLVGAEGKQQTEEAVAQIILSQ